MRRAGAWRCCSPRRSREPRWAVAGGVGAILAVAVSTVIYAIGIGLGGAFGGSEVVTPMAGTAALGLYAAAMVGVGVAIGGLWRRRGRPSWWPPSSSSRS